MRKKDASVTRGTYTHTRDCFPLQIAFRCPLFRGIRVWKHAVTVSSPHASADASPIKQACLSLETCAMLAMAMARQSQHYFGISHLKARNENITFFLDIPAYLRLHLKKDKGERSRQQQALISCCSGRRRSLRVRR